MNEHFLFLSGFLVNLANLPIKDYSVAPLAAKIFNRYV